MNVAALLEPASLATGGPERNNKRLCGAQDRVPPRAPPVMQRWGHTAVLWLWGPVGPLIMQGGSLAPWSPGVQHLWDGSSDTAQHPSHGASAPAAKLGSTSLTTPQTVFVIGVTGVLCRLLSQGQPLHPLQDTAVSPCRKSAVSPLYCGS